MNISATMVKELRDKTGAGMMECKQALTEANGDTEKAVNLLRERGAAKAERRMGRAAKEGRIEVYLPEAGKGAALVELNCETDFVAKTDDFQELARDLARHVYETSPGEGDLMNQPYNGRTVGDVVRERAARVGENVMVSRFEKFEGFVTAYVHHDAKGAGVIELQADDQATLQNPEVVDLGRDLALQVYGSAPRWLRKEEVPAHFLEAERQVYRTQAETEGKQGKALEGYVEGQVRNFYEENCLLEQIFVRDLAKPKKERRKVEQLLKDASAKTEGNVTVSRFARFRVGEA